MEGNDFSDNFSFKGTHRTVMKSRSHPMWVFKDELMKLYSDGNNPPYGSTLHRIERYQYRVRDPAEKLIAYRVIHTRPKY